MPKTELKELFTRDLGVIAEAHLDFAPGFNVITGETGAGKTLLLGALALCLGADTAPSRHVLGPETRAVALFVQGEREILLARESGEGGRLRASVDGAPSSAEALRLAAAELVVIHGQRESLTLRQRADVVRLVDQFGGVDTRELEATRRALAEVKSRQEGLGGDGDARAKEVELFEYQLRELRAGALESPDELEDRLEELARLTALRDGQVALTNVLARFDDDGDDAVLARFASVLAELPEGSVYDEARQALEGALVTSRDALRELRTLSDPETLDPETLGALDVRVTTLQALARKYGGSLRSALAERDALAQRLATLSSDAVTLERLDREINELATRDDALADEARRARLAAAAALSDAVAAQLARVALGGARLIVEVGGVDGGDAKILFSANPGHAPAPLAAAASGGELSRVLLALSLEAAPPDVVAIFDEVDAGIGGQVAQQIGECLAEVSRNQQVLAVTHLASVAARAERHFVIDKVVEGDETRTSVRAVEGEERVREVARMLAGDDVTTASLTLARQLLEKTDEVSSSGRARR